MVGSLVIVDQVLSVDLCYSVRTPGTGRELAVILRVHMETDRTFLSLPFAPVRSPSNTDLTCICNPILTLGESNQW